MRPHALPLLVLLLAPSAVAATEIQRDPVASVTNALDAVTAVTRVRPGVVVTLTVVTHGRSAEDASERNAMRMIGVLAALRRQSGAVAVVPTGQVVTREDEWDGEGRAPRDSLVATEYAARHGVRMTIHDLASLGPMLDTALAAGATAVVDISLVPTDLLSDRRRAAELALRTARDDLVATVTPREGRLRRLLELGLMVRALSCR